MTRAAWESPPDSAFSGPALEDNSLETGTGKLIAQNREFIETSREFAAPCRELSAGRGKFPGRAKSGRQPPSRTDGVFQVAVAANPGWQTRVKI